MDQIQAVIQEYLWNPDTPHEELVKFAESRAERTRNREFGADIEGDNIVRSEN